GIWPAHEKERDIMACKQAKDGSWSGPHPHPPPCPPPSLSSSIAFKATDTEMAHPKESSLWDWLVVAVILHQGKSNYLVCKIVIHWRAPCSMLLSIQSTRRSNALPPLDWPLPSQFDQYELRIEVQPRPHHRAHYETEGSRGAVKATPTGHPIVKLCGYTERKPLSLQVFVGTADDRSIRPHPFYQIHRVTGKMVGTSSHESVQAGTKLLDIPLNPENNMTALIDCAGILKLRNSDIELRKGETDVGRKNTRVRLVFRTHLHLPPPGAPPGRVLALQVASLAIECSQRSAQELPVIESVSLTSCSVEGGEELLLSGSNFLPISRVIFMERGTGKGFTYELSNYFLGNSPSLDRIG
uniref:Nuclear factor of activated T cells 4 n=1 Tax=Sander lucioperca TaxID=283035 RepID=A0A8C9ZQZ4_SANLU